MTTGSEEVFDGPINAKGIKERTRIENNSDGTRSKIIQQIRVEEIEQKVLKRVLGRKGLAKFGWAISPDAEKTKVTTACALQMIEHPDDQMDKQEDSSNTKGMLTDFIARREERNRNREVGIETDDSNMIQEGGGNTGGKGLDNIFGGSAGDGKYRPPQREGMSMGGGNSSDSTDCTIKVSNLTTKADEDILRGLFSRFGRVTRVSLPRRDGKNGPSKGFAYIAFATRSEAERAFENLQGHGFGHLILRLEWAKDTQRQQSNPGGEDNSRRYRSGYGQALAQDTKEQVSYASNLTANR